MVSDFSKTLKDFLSEDSFFFFDRHLLSVCHHIFAKNKKKYGYDNKGRFRRKIQISS